MSDPDREKVAVGRAAAELVEDGMKVGLGTGSTVRELLPALAERKLQDLRCVATSTATEQQARELGLAIEPFSELDCLDIAIDGADQVAIDGWLVKGGGGAHTREKIVAAAADRFVVIAGADKVVDRLEPPIPLELFPFGLEATLRHLGSHAVLRPDTPRTPDGGIIADYRDGFDDPEELAAKLASVPGVIDHGLFAAALVSEILVARGEVVERRTV